MDRSNPDAKVAAHRAGGTGLIRIPYPIGVRTVTVRARERLGPRMLRLTVGGPTLAGFHSYQCDDHVRVVFADADGRRRDPVPNDSDMLDWPTPMPRTRKYTVRRWDPERLELDLDVVLHGSGLAAVELARREVGDALVIAGPPGAKAFAHTYDHFVFAVDPTALPAAARFLEEAPAGLSATVVVESDDAEDHDYPLPHPDGVTVCRLVSPPGQSRLAATVARLNLPPGRCLLFAAGEADDIRPLRAWRREGSDALVTGYWKRGTADHDA